MVSGGVDAFTGRVGGKYVHDSINETVSSWSVNQKFRPLQMCGR